VVTTEITGELVDQDEVSEHHPDVSAEHVWAGWRLPTLEELVHTWPARHEPSEYEKDRGWWQPTLIELREARRQAKSRDWQGPVAARRTRRARVRKLKKKAVAIKLMPSLTAGERCDRLLAGLFNNYDTV